ncbi:hypothetical protein E2P81_ATG02166 [Venturia nashicola]|nr:hypothetical protein E2P81_ATG02166 [Venturia nashicola]
MDHEEQLVQIESDILINIDDTVPDEQETEDATQVQDDIPAATAIPDGEPDEDVSDQEGVIELSPEDAELLAIRFNNLVEEAMEEPDAIGQTEGEDGGFEDSIIAAEHRDVQAVADLNDLQFGTQQCYICTDDVCYSKVLQLGCEEHWICRDCIADPFEQAIQQESCYPPKCCDLTGPLRIEEFAHLLAISHPDLAARYDAKLQEYHIDRRFRRYCGSDDCKAFLNPESYERDDENKTSTADCPTCNRSTCVFCTKIVFKATSHECESTVLKLNKDYSAEARFKYCPFCERPGLLNEACNHVTCDCGEEWCFICLRKWSGGYDHEECVQYNDPVYDSEGYDENGFHRDTGVDRLGFNRDGFDVAGFDRDGNKVTDFARRERDRPHAPAPRPAGFLDLNDENFEEAAMIIFISERETGRIHETDNFEDLLAIRFPGFNGGHHAHGGGRGRGRGGFRGGRGRGGRGGGWGGQFHGDDEEVEDEDDFDQVPPPPIVDTQAGDGNWGDQWAPPAVAANNDGWGEVEADNEQAEPNHDALGHGGDFDGQFGGGIEIDPDQNVQNDDLDAEAGLGWADARTDANAVALDNEADLDTENNSDGPQPPTAAQIQCQHHWDLANPGNLCKACTLTCEEYAMVCTTCNVEACGDCAPNFAGNALLNWPGADVVGEVEGGV